MALPTSTSLPVATVEELHARYDGKIPQDLLNAAKAQERELTEARDNRDMALELRIQKGHREHAIRQGLIRLRNNVEIFRKACRGEWGSDECNAYFKNHGEIEFFKRGLRDDIAKLADIDAMLAALDLAEAA